MAIRDQLLRKQLQQQAQHPQATYNTADIHETAKPYRRWIPGIRSFLRLRYLSAKKSVLIENKQELRYDVSTDELQNSVSNKLDKNRGIWSILLNPLVAAPLLVLLLAAAAWGAWLSYQSALDRAVFRADIPAYSDAVYRIKATYASATDQDDPEKQKAIDQNATEQEAQAEELKQKILQHFSKVPNVPEKLDALLEGIQQKDLAPQDLYKLVKIVNDELFINRIPYYISPMVETADCAHLPLTAFLGRLFGGAQGSGDLCVVYALLTFHVDEFRYYNAEQQDHLAFFTRRLDHIQVNENVLGKVHLGDDSAQILLSNIDATSADSTVAVNDGQLQTKLMPEGMADVYGLESIARRLQTRVVDQYATELKQSWKWKFEKVWHRLNRAESSLLPAATAKLQRRVADITAFHEVQHLIDQFNDLQEPPWFDETLNKVAINFPMTPQFSNHVLWELSAFFTHISYADELKGVLLNELAAITLDPLLQDQPHYYSIRILLPILHEMHQGTLSTTPPDPALSLSDVARSYKYLAKHIDSMDTVARDAYQLLFGSKLPDISKALIQTRKAPDLRINESKRQQ